MSMWRLPKPVIAQVHGWCVGGGSDMALLADLVIASGDARIGTPYARMWGAYLTGMWIYRLGLTRARESPTRATWSSRDGLRADCRRERRAARRARRTGARAGAHRRGPGAGRG